MESGGTHSVRSWDFLKDRTQRVQLEGQPNYYQVYPREQSSDHLFSSSSSMTTKSEARLFAYDYLYYTGSLYRRIDSETDPKRLQEDLSSFLERWEKEWKMMFHREKCVLIKVSR